MTASTPKRSTKRRSSPRDAARSLKSTKCVLTRRSEKKRSALRVSASFLTPKICTSNESPLRDHAQEALAVARELGRTDPRDFQQIAFRARACLRHLPQRAVAEHQVGRNALPVGDVLAQRAQPLEQLVGRV